MQTLGSFSKRCTLVLKIGLVGIGVGMVKKVNYKIYDSVFSAIHLAAESFEKQYGNLNNSSNFELYGHWLENAIIQFNQDHHTSYHPGETLEKWAEALEFEINAVMADDDMRFMDEALENWNNLNNKN